MLGGHTGGPTAVDRPGQTRNNRWWSARGRHCICADCET